MVQSELRTEVSRIIGDCMGASILSRAAMSSAFKNPERAGLFCIAASLIIFTLPIWWLDSQTLTLAVKLSIWGAFYFGWAVFVARLTTRSLVSIIEADVESFLSDSQKEFVIHSLKTSFPRVRINIVSVIVAMILAGATWKVLGDSGVEGFQLAWIAMLFIILYATAAQATYSACFYKTFSTAIDHDPSNLAVFVPSESPVVLAVRSIGESVLLFWFGIMLAVLTLMVFSETLTTFVLLVVPVASFFSFIFGTAVFIIAEYRIRRACRRSSVLTRKRLDNEARFLLEEGTPLTENAIDHLVKLSQIGEAIESRRVRSISLVLISIVTPLAGPLVALAIHLSGESNTENGISQKTKHDIICEKKN